MFTLLLIIHVIVCLVLIFFVLIQSGRGADLGAAFGSMGQATYARGHMSGVGMITTGTATIFMLTSLGLAYLSSEQSTKSVVKDIPAVQQQVQPSPAEMDKTATSPELVPEEEKQMEQMDAPMMEQQDAPAIAPKAESPASSDELPVETQATDSMNDDSTQKVAPLNQQPQAGQ
ncbi:MAG: preprotein translocase subunit SecG [SAR324 cluster bacterium]|nr:preprotein translocase subunit SecG [SAR324 cluster bacterium]